jgi:hypothetical protein
VNRIGLRMGKAFGRIKKALKSDAVRAVMVGLGVALDVMTVNVLTPIAAAEAQTVSPSISRDHPPRTPIKHLQ